MGLVEAVNVDSPRSDGVWMLGSTRVAAGVYEGDSGSAVWTFNGSAVGGNDGGTLYGIVYAGSNYNSSLGVYTKTWFSPYGNVQYQLGPYELYPCPGSCGYK